MENKRQREDDSNANQTWHPLNKLRGGYLSSVGIRRKSWSFSH